MSEFYILVILLSILLISIITLIFIILKKSSRSSVSTNDQKDLQNELKLYLKDEYSELKLDLLKILNESNDKNKTNIENLKEVIVKNVDEQLSHINKKVDERLGDGFKKSQETFVSVVERLTKIDEAQKNIESLSTEVLTLNNILIDRKTRGTFGEIQLHHLLSSVLGENNELYQEQTKLSTGVIADVILHAPSPLGSIVIDSKFPLVSYQLMYDSKLSQIERDQASSQFKKDIRKHINDISSKYIIEDETANQAIMFIPAEAIFAEIVSNHVELVNYSNEKKVWLASPTTLLSTLTVIQSIVKNMERDKQTHLIIEELNLLSKEFERYFDRWEKLERQANSLTTSIKEVNTTSLKISKRFKNIEEGKLNQIESGDYDDAID